MKKNGYLTQGAVLLFVTYRDFKYSKLSKGATGTQEVVSDENIEAQGDLLTSKWVINVKALP